MKYTVALAILLALPLAAQTPTPPCCRCCDTTPTPTPTIPPGVTPTTTPTPTATIIPTPTSTPAPATGACTLSGAVTSFEPHPWGATRPQTLSPGFNSNVALYTVGAGRRMLMQESFGYSILDLRTPTQPMALLYQDNRFTSNAVLGNACGGYGGDGQSDVAAIAVSADGQRAVFSLAGPAEAWGTIAGVPGDGFVTWSSSAPPGASSAAISLAGGRYVAYYVAPNAVYAADITAMPSVFCTRNAQSEVTPWLGGNTASLSGPFLSYMTSGAVQVVNISSPGPVGSIVAGMTTIAVTQTDLSGHVPQSYAAAIDPANPAKLWLLIEVRPTYGVENSPSFALVTVQAGVKTRIGGLWRVPSLPGEVYYSGGASSQLVNVQGALYAIMWSNRQMPTVLRQLYTTTTSAWGTTGPPVPMPQAATPGQPAASLSSGRLVFTYLPTGPSAYVIPLVCP